MGQIVTVYDAAFFDYVTDESLRSAQIMMPWVLKQTGAQKVIDVGCGSGAWASVAKEQGCTVHGTDNFVPEDRLLIDPSEFSRVDLTEPFDCSGYDLAICLEVGEHLPEGAARGLVAGLCKARYVFFGAAVPGQGGVDHVSERWQGYWSSLFAASGLVGTDEVRREFWHDKRIAVYYRQNVALYGGDVDLSCIGMRSRGVLDVVHPDMWSLRIGLPL